MYLLTLIPFLIVTSKKSLRSLRRVRPATVAPRRAKARVNVGVLEALIVKI